MASDAEDPSTPEHQTTSPTQAAPSNDDQIDLTNDAHDEASTTNDNPLYHPEPTASSIALTLTHHGTKHTLYFAPSATLSDLSSTISSHPSFQLPPTHQKLLISPKPGLIKPPFSAATIAAFPLSSLTARKIQLLGHAPAAIASLQNAVTAGTAAHAARSNRAYPIAPATPAPTRNRTAQNDTTYSFASIRPLAHLPRPERSAALLQRLAADAGIRATMQSHKFRVGLLTEMDPAAHTTHDSRTLGLNRNRGEIIELRLRTDAYDGYRDYKTIRRTLCHELAHNVWGEHDGNFWALCREIEGEVERKDWRRGGRRVGGRDGDDVFELPVDPEMRGDAVDHGGWTGGTFVLGGGESGTLSGSSSSGGGGGGAVGRAAAPGADPVSRREMMARAAEERAKRASQEKEGKK
ncbi:WLM domain-containing protein [Phyllosticta citriasiana]|uniref:WLM domain-containing protein n=1 Tax=Phyllosticta citriasiana TaxID=595635 RepID=A0ABR1L2E0_9PEZI